MATRKLPILLLAVAAFLPSITVHAQLLPRARPEEVGISSDRLERLAQQVTDEIASGQLVGAVSVVARKGRLVHLHAAGMSDVAAQRALGTDGIFRIASMTKPIVTVAALLLHEDGKLILDDPVSKYIPELRNLKVFSPDFPQGEPARREMTVQDLMTHMSGLTYGLPSAFLEGRTVVDSLYREARLSSGTSREMIDQLGRLPLLHHPGEQWEYSRSTDVLGYLIEVVAQEPLDVFLKTQVFQPLGMVDTDFYIPDQKRDRAVQTYERSERGTLQPAGFPPFSRPLFLSGGGGLVSTAQDYLRFAQMLLNGGVLDSVRILSPRTVAMMVRNHVPAAALPLTSADVVLNRFVRGYGFGLGVRVLADPAAPTPASPGAFGWAGAYNTYFWIDPQQELIGLLFTQTLPFGNDIHRRFEALMYQTLIE